MNGLGVVGYKVAGALNKALVIGVVGAFARYAPLFIEAGFLVVMQDTFHDALKAVVVAQREGDTEQIR